MSTNIFGRETVNQYADLHASVLRIAEKSKEEPEESKGFKDISPQEALRNVQNTYAQMKQAPKEGKQEELVEKSKVEEGTSLQVKMALSDVNLKGTGKDGKVFVKKKDVKKAEKALKGNVIYKGGTPEVVGEEVIADSAALIEKEEQKLSKYQKFAAMMLKKFGVDSPSELDKAGKKKYFDALDKGWDAKDEKPEPGDKKKEK